MIVVGKEKGRNRINRMGKEDIVVNSKTRKKCQSLEIVDVKSPAFMEAHHNMYAYALIYGI